MPGAFCSVGCLFLYMELSSSPWARSRERLHSSVWLQNGKPEQQDAIFPAQTVCVCRFVLRVQVDAVLRAAVFFPYLLFLMSVSLFECFRAYTERAVAAVSACVFVFCCVFETWQVIAVRSGATVTRGEEQDGSLRYTSFDVLQQGDASLELLLVVLLTASSVRTSLIFYVHLAAIASVLFRVGVQSTTVGSGLLIGVHVSEGYTALVCILVVMYLGYYKETCHRMAFYSWYCAKYKACPAGIKKLTSMTTFARW